MQDPDNTCQHLSFEAVVEVNRIQEPHEPVKAYIADVNINCAECGESFTFIGLEAGLRADCPMGSFNGNQAHLPIRPKSAPFDFGLNMPGFVIKVAD
jgi:hypothetical protein